MESESSRGFYSCFIVCAARTHSRSLALPRLHVTDGNNVLVISNKCRREEAKGARSHLYYDLSDGLPGRYLCGGRLPPRLARQGAHLVVAAEAAAATAALPHALPAPCLQDPRLPSAALLALLLRQGAPHPLAGHLQGRERLTRTQQPLKRSVKNFEIEFDGFITILSISQGVG